MNVERCLELLPERYHDEFVGDVLVDKASITRLDKVFEYYIQDIIDELSVDELEKLQEDMIIISL